MKIWEYLEIISSTQRRFIGNLSSQVIDAGQDGWELVTIIVDNKYPSEERWIFKKPIPNKRDYE